MKETPYLEGNEHLLTRYGYIAMLGTRNKPYLEQLLRVSKLRFYDEGDIISTEGEQDNWVYILLDGEVIISKRESKLATINNPGEVFGELTMIDNHPRSATISVENKAVCLAININLVDDMQAKERYAFFPFFFLTLTNALSSRLRATDEELTRLKAELASYKK